LANLDALVKSRNPTEIVIPAFAGVTTQETFYETINLGWLILREEACIPIQQMKSIS